MTTRTSKKTVTFAHPFTLCDYEEVFQPGTYDVETDEERLEGVSFEAYRRVQTLGHLEKRLEPEPVLIESQQG